MQNASAQFAVASKNNRQNQNHWQNDIVVINDLIGLKSFFRSETGALGEDRTSTLPVPSQKGIHCAPTRPCAHGIVEDSDIHILSYMNDRAFLYSQHIHHHTDP